MPGHHSTSDFLSRFDRLVRSYRRASVLQAVFGGLLVLLLALGAVAAIDFFFEVSRDVRAVATSAILVVTVGSLAWLSFRALVKTSDDSVAAKLESDFPELGQAVRTSVQFRQSVVGAGVSPSLVSAMQRDLSVRSNELPLHETVPTGKLYRAIALFGGAAAALIILTVISWQWRTATLRTLFGDQPYTELTVEPGDTRVDEGGTLQVTAEVHGRVDRPTTLMTRPMGGDETAWTSQKLGEENIAEQAADYLVYQVALANVREPLEYRVTSGPYVTQAHRVEVRHPLSIESIRVELSPPAYTGLSSTVVDEGNFHAVAGSRAQVAIKLDRPVKSATITLAPLNRRGALAGDEQPQVLPLTVTGETLSGEFDLTQDVLYAIEGRAADGSQIRKNRYRIRVREDRPPRIAFDEPSGETEVHALAEMIMRARANDDYGLTRAGVVFQVNNGQEYPLIVREFQNGSDAAAASPDKERRVARVGAAHAEEQQQNVTKVEMEKQLPLEHFELTQKDSITYYAFAEDNPPGGPRRVRTDLQFIDIRPFRRLYRSVEGGRGGGGGGGGGPQLASLEELISRERFVLNRTLRLARSSEPGRRMNLDEIDQIIPLQQNNAELTRELADAVAEFEDEEGVTEDRVSDLFYSAEQAMLAAMDSLTVGNYDTAALQEQDALRYLVEGRNAVEVLIGGAGGGALARLFQANRRLLQKLRRPKSQVERAAEASRMLRNLANREQEVYDSLAEMLRSSMPGDDPSADAEMQPGDRRQRRELEKKQLDISLDAERVDEVVQEIESMTELARARSTKSVELASQVTGALEQGNTGNAADQAQVASGLFRELAVQIDGVTALEPVGRIAVARDLASRMAVDSRNNQADLSKQMQSPPESASEREAEQSGLAAALARRSAQWSDTAGTIEDVLKSIVQTYNAEQDDAVGRIERLLAEAGLSRVTEHLQRLENTVEGRDWRTAELELEALADRMDDLAQRLDAVHRSLVSPRVEQLRAFEVRAVELAKALSLLTGDEQITRWHRKADALLEDLESAEVQLAATDRLQKAMQAAGWKAAPSQRWGWDAGESNLRIAPEEHAAAMQALVSDIQRYIQELVVGGIFAADADAVPPQYVPLVRRYLEVLSKDGGD
ncbi:MAG: hypothetical protein WD894_01350 [Pirellulales bacterium]